MQQMRPRIRRLGDRARPCVRAGGGGAIEHLPPHITASSPASVTTAQPRRTGRNRIVLSVHMETRIYEVLSHASIVLANPSVCPSVTL